MRNDAAAVSQPRQLIDHIPAHVVPRFLGKRGPVEFRVPEILRDEYVAIDKGGAESAALLGPSLAQRVMNVEAEIIRKPTPQRRLERVIDHRLLAANVIASRRAQPRVRPHAGRSIKRLSERP